MKLLYLSCHAILEYDELKLFEELGIDYFALGSYINPQKPVDPIRPALNKIVDPKLLHMEHDRECLTKEFVDNFDVIVVMHLPEWIEKNWAVMRHKRVIWRTIGQSTPAIERRLFPYRQDGLQVVRYSKREANIHDTIGCDKIIHFYKDPQEFDLYKGITDEVITFSQNMQHRAEHCNYETFCQITYGFNSHIYGPNNESSGQLSGGFLTYEEMKQKMRDARVYISTGTQPASYTLNFIEAFMTGIPMICIGPEHGNSLNKADGLYEVPDFIINGVNGFVSDDITYLREMVKKCIDKPDYAKVIGKAGRETAIGLFGKDGIKLKWKEFLGI